jgi:glycosyltransferase involved in cell wall biosynthesis
VGYVVDSDGYGGAERVLVEVIRRLDRDRWRPVLLFREDVVPLRTRLELGRLGVEQFGLPAPPLSARFMAEYIVRTVRQIRRSRASLVHLNQHHWQSGRHTALASWLLRAPVVSTVHLLPPDVIAPDVAQRVVNRIGARWIAVSTDIAQRLVTELGVGRERVRTIHNGVELATFAHAPDPARVARLRQELGAGDDPRRAIVLAVGRLATQKRFDLLIRAISELPDVTLALAGDGDLRTVLARQAADLGAEGRVRFLGDRSDIPDLLHASDLVAMTSASEGLPLVLLEAMAAGRAVVAPRIPGIESTIEDGRTGLLVPPGDAVALRGAIRRLVDAPDLRATLGAVATATVAARFTADRMAAGVVREYEALVPR